MGLLMMALAKVAPALAAKITAAGVASGVVIYRAVKPPSRKRR